MTRFLITMAVLFASLPAMAQPQANATPSRLADGSTDACYAPCAVQWDATSTTHTSPSFGDDDLLFGLLYQWDYGDPASGTWITGHSQNKSEGFIGAHVFRNPGTYTVTLTVSDHLQERHQWTDTVVVSDPSSLTTYCFSNDGSFSGCPIQCPSSQCVQTSRVQDIAGYIGSNRRLLLEKGNTFSGGGISTGSASRLIIGTYGSGQRPLWRADYSHGGVFVNGGSDVRIIGIDFESSGYAAGVVWPHGISVDGADHLVLDNEVSGFFIQLYHGEGSSPRQNLIMAENRFGNPPDAGEGMGMYGAILDGAALGNLFATAVGGGPEIQHQTRWAKFNDSLYAYNRHDQGVSRHQAKMHAYDSSGTMSSRWVYSGNQHLNCDEVWCVAIGPQSDLFDERTWYGLIEGNYLTGAPDNNGGDSGMIGIIFWGSYSTARNNICDFTGIVSGYGFTCIEAGSRRALEPAASNNRIYNNTAYRGAGTGGATAVSGSGTDGFSRNNLLFAPSGGAQVASNYWGQNTLQSKNFVATTNPFSATSFNDPSDFELGDTDDSGDARNEGDPILNTQMSDFFGKARPAEGQWDIGACEYGLAGLPAPAAPILLP